MKQKMKHMISLTCTVLMAFTMILPSVTADVYAAYNDDGKLVVVSFGDSYASGEGIEPFYGQGETKAKIYDLDWLAHRSELSWPGLLTFSEIKGHTLKEYKYDAVYSDICQWYFLAASGARTEHIIYKTQSKFVRIPHPTLGYLSNDQPLPIQIDILDTIDSSAVDYVTLTIGGNDVQFSTIVRECVIGSSYLHFPGSGYPPYYDYGTNKSLSNLISGLWENIETTRKNISDVYTKILNRAPNAEVIVAGYPELLDYDGKGTVISKEEAWTVNRNVRMFNNNLERLVEGCNNPRIHFVSVEEKFEGHQAYSDNSWINEIEWGPNSEDLAWVPYENDKGKVEYSPASDYSMHPNKKGAEAYARCVNAKIEEIEFNGTIKDSWEQIIASCNDGTYKTKYQIGDTKALDLGSEEIVQMQIIAFDADELADGSGTAAITWLSKQLLNTNHRINPTLTRDPADNSKYLNGTGTIGGWANSEMRAWLKSDIKPLIPSNVRNSIKTVKKYTNSFDTSQKNIQNEMTVDDVWIPSYREMGRAESYYESKGPVYSDMFADDTNAYSTGDRVKLRKDGTRAWWWLRSANVGNSFYGRCVTSDGGMGMSAAYNEAGVAIGFCM